MRLVGFLAAVLALCGVAAGGDAPSATPPPPVLAQVQGKVQKILDSMDKDLAAAAAKLAKTGLTGEGARAILLDLVRAHPYVIDCCTVNMVGKMATVEPKPYREFEGTDISYQEQIRRLHRTRKPVMSIAFVAAEGFVAVDLEHPIFDASNKMIGSVSMLIRPELFLKKIIEPEVKGVPVDCWVMQTGGFILFDPDEEEVGRNLFRDPLYSSFTELLALGRKMAQSESGMGTYDFLMTGLEKHGTKRAHWATAGLHGTAWRIVMVKMVKGDREVAKRRFSDLELAASNAALRKLAADPKFVRLIRAGDHEGVLALFRDFFKTHRSTYTIQWAEDTGVVRFGYPPENSLTNFDFRKRRNLGARKFVEAIRAGKETFFELRLIEGGVGMFFLCPVQSDGKTIGMLYTIRKKARK